MAMIPFTLGFLGLNLELIAFYAIIVISLNKKRWGNDVQ